MALTKVNPARRGLGAVNATVDLLSQLDDAGLLIFPRRVRLPDHRDMQFVIGPRPTSDRRPLRVLRHAEVRPYIVGLADALEAIGDPRAPRVRELLADFTANADVYTPDEQAEQP
jgi:hypothetical protein